MKTEKYYHNPLAIIPYKPFSPLKYEPKEKNKQNEDIQNLYTLAIAEWSNKKKTNEKLLNNAIKEIYRINLKNRFLTLKKLS